MIRFCLALVWLVNTTVCHFFHTLYLFCLPVCGCIYLWPLWFVLKLCFSVPWILPMQVHCLYFWLSCNIGFFLLFVTVVCSSFIMLHLALWWQSLLVWIWMYVLVHSFAISFAFSFPSVNKNVDSHIFNLMFSNIKHKV